MFCLTAAWLIAMRWREGWKPGEELSRMRFNAVQLVLAVFTFFTILTLVFSGIRNGLLRASRHAHRRALGSASGYTWFQDQTAGVLETPSSYLGADVGLSRAVLRLGGWMAFALVRWLRWAFNAWKNGGLWRTA